MGALDLNEPRAADHWGFKAGVNTEIAGTLPADLLLKGRVKEGREPAKYLLDFTTKHPNPFADNQTALVAGTAARLAEEAKFRHYNKGRKRKGEGGKKERREKKEERKERIRSLGGSPTIPGNSSESNSEEIFGLENRVRYNTPPT